MLLRSQRRRAWAIVGALSVTETTSWGVLFYGFPVFLRPMEAELGWSRAELAGAFSVALLVQGVAGVAVGRWLDRRSPRALMTAGSVAATALTLAWSRVESLPAFYLLWAAMGAVMATVLYEPAFTVVTKWFTTDRRRALTTVTLVAGLASFIFLPLENWLIEQLGWRDALVVLAVILGVITIPLHALVLRPAPEPEPEPTPVAEPPTAGVHPATQAEPIEHSAREALGTPAFWYLAAAMVATSFVISVLAVHQVAFLVELGYTAAFAAAATGVLGAMQLPGRLLFAPLLRILPRRTVTTVVFGLVAVGLLVLAAGGGLITVWAFIVLYGMGRGMVTLLRATLVGELFGARHYGAITGVLAACTTVALALGPVSAGLLHDLVGDYRAVIWVLVATSVVATVAAARVERRPLPRRLPSPA